MRNKIKLFLNKNRRWIYTLEYIFYSLIILGLVTYIDTGNSKMVTYIPRFLFSSVELAKTVLSALVSALLTISTFTFSTILTVLVLYNGSFTPRSIGDFINKKITMKVLGIYIGGFVYCLVSLNFMTVGSGDRNVIAGTVGVIYAIVCAIYFLIFIHHVLSGMSISNLIDKILNKTLQQIEVEVERRGRDADYVISQSSVSKTIYAPKSGYFEMMDESKIENILIDNQLIFIVQPQIGDFVIKNTPLGYLSEDILSEDDENKIREQFVLVDSRIDDGGFHQGMRKILEIALRALSPGINDPNTAIHCLRKLGICLATLSAEDGETYCLDNESKAKIYYRASNFRSDVIEIINPILTYGKTDASIVRAVFEMLLIIKESATPKNRDIIVKLSKDIYDNARESLDRGMEIEIISKYYNRILYEPVKRV